MTRPHQRHRGRSLGLLVVALTSVGCSYASRSALPKAAVSMQSSTLYATDGTPVHTFHAEENRQDVALEQMPVHLRDAVVAIEDERFYRHHGLDLRAVLRAVRANADAGSVAQGGSTITQQYVKKVLLGDSSKTAERKIREATLAVQLERHYSKDRILELYLNAIYFGNGAYGVEAAAQQYFKKDVGRLTLAEDALLAGLIQRPSANDPFDDPTAALARRDVVLERMRRNHFATDQEIDAALQEPLRLGDPTVPAEERYPAAYFVESVKDWILHDTRFGATAKERQDLLFGGGLKIQTTVDLADQAAAEAAANAILPNTDGPDVALVSMDPKTGAIRAMVGGRDFFGPGSAAKFNLANPPAGYGRPAGSSFKPLVLAEALTQGIKPSATYAGPAHISIPNADAGHAWEVGNYSDGEAFGETNLVEATVHSVNTIFAQLMMDVGPKAAMDKAAELGVRSPLRPDAAAVLGTNEVTPVDMASAYSTFANRGLAVPPVLVTRITRADGTVLYAHRQTEQRVLSADVADTLTAILQQVVQRGTGTAARLAWPVAGKTGTGNHHQDAWFVGYTAQLTTAVWVGFNKGQIRMEPPRTAISVTGGSYPARIWQRYMSEAMAGQPLVAFHPPPADALTGVTATPPLAETTVPAEDVQAQIDAYYAARGIDPNDPSAPPYPGYPDDPFATTTTDVVPSTTTTATTAPRAKIVAVPKVTGKQVGAAIAQLNAAGFNVARYAASGSSAVGTVVAQSPGGGSLAAQGSTVTIGVIGG
jgi:penicillin-binding protein 1A